MAANIFSKFKSEAAVIDSAKTTLLYPLTFYSKVIILFTKLKVAMMLVVITW